MGNWLTGNDFLPFSPFDLLTYSRHSSPFHLHGSGNGAIFYFLGAFFLPATVLRLPLRVRLLVRVR